MKKKIILDRKKELLNKSFSRVRIPENRDLFNGLRMNRMERVEDFPKNFLEKVFSKTKKYDLGKYPDQSLIYNKLSNFLKLDKKKILLTSGMDGGIKTIFEVLTKPGDKIGLLSPTYAMYSIYSNLFKVRLTEIGYNKFFKLKRKKLIEYIKSSPKIIFLPNPNQPIEDPMTINEIKKICKLSFKYKVLVVVDEAYNMFGTPSALPLINKYNNLIVLRTFSKSFGVPSIRFGYLASNKNTIKILSAYRLSYETNFLTDTVATYLIDNIQIVKRYIDKVKNGRNYLLRELKKLNIKAIGGKSSTVLINFNDKFLCKKIYKNLIKNKIYVKGNYSNLLQTCILVQCGPINYMQRFLLSLKGILKK